MPPRGSSDWLADDALVLVVAAVVAGTDGSAGASGPAIAAEGDVDGAADGAVVAASGPAVGAETQPTADAMTAAATAIGTRRTLPTLDDAGPGPADRRHRGEPAGAA